MSNLNLHELLQQVTEKQNCEAKQFELKKQRKSVAANVEKLKKAAHSEQADVDRLERRSLAAFFYQAIGQIDKKLDKERQEAYAARVKYDAAVRDLSSIDADLEQIEAKLVSLKNCEQQYQTALSDKFQAILATNLPAAQNLADSEMRIARLKTQKKELQEATAAGKGALASTNSLLETLDNAEGWSTWDIMGGGLIADLAKYSELDTAQEQAEQLQIKLRRFKTELADVEIQSDLQITVDSFLKFADFFFDGLLADWAVMNHIDQVQTQVQSTKAQIKQVLATLKKMSSDVDIQIEAEQKNQEQLILQTELPKELLCI